MSFSLFFMPLKDEKKPVFFTLDPVAALVYNRTDRWVKIKRWINNNNDNDKWNNFNTCGSGTFIENLLYEKK